MMLLLFACSTAPVSPPGPCSIMAAPASGPLSAERAQVAADPLALARLHIREARITGDAGFYTLAETALDCGLERDPAGVETRELRAHVLLQFHRFAEAEAEARAISATHDTWLAHALLGDALMEQGKLDAAADAYQAAMDKRPGLAMYDRVGWLRWLWGDVAGALEMQDLAVRAGSTGDPEPFAWVLVRLGWLHALAGAPAPELDAALRLVPDYKPALFALGRVHLHAGEPAAALAALRAAGPTVEAVRALAELDPAASIEAVKAQDPRGYAIWLAETRPEEAARILDAEWAARQDAVTRMARAYARFRAGQDAAAEARAALATGIVEPRVLLQGGLILDDPALLARAAASGPGLLPSERRLLPPGLRP